MPQQRPIDRAFFRETEDGTTIFFPWGLAHRGYQLTDEDAQKKASQAASLLICAVIGIGVWTGHALQPIFESEAPGLGETLRLLAAPGAALLAVIACYLLWISRFVERLPESDLRVSLEDRLREAAEYAEPWKIALIGAVLCGLSALVIWIRPSTWWFGAIGAAAGIGVLYWSSLLMRAAADRRD